MPSGTMTHHTSHHTYSHSSSETHSPSSTTAHSPAQSDAAAGLVPMGSFALAAVAAFVL
jgi:hypothetical protein